MYDPTMTLREEDYIEYLALRHALCFFGYQKLYFFYVVGSVFELKKKKY
jgi:hypothetical protein